MGIAKIYAVNLVIPVLDHTRSSALTRHGRLYCAHYHLKSSHVASHAIEASRATLI